MIRIQLYDRTKCVSGFIDDKGNLDHSLDAYWVSTDYMSVEPKSTCYYAGISYVGIKQYAAYYDKDLKFISKFIPSNSGELKIPENVYYVRFSLCKHTKINLFNDELEEGSLNYISGSNESGATFTRSKNHITISPKYGEAQLQTGQEYTISTSVPVYQMSILYYRNTPTGVIYDSYIDTPFTQELNKLTFTLPKNENICYLRTRFYTPDMNRDFTVMLNNGDIALDYTPPATEDLDDRYSFSFEMLSEAYRSFRDDLYKWLKETISPNISTGDLDIIIRLMCYIFGDLMGTTYKLKDQIDPDAAEEYYLRHLCTCIGYEWNEGLTAAQQRESIKMFIDLRKRRGTVWSIQNLISVFGQDRNSYYSTSDLRGVKVIECMSDARPDENGLYPGDIMIEIPQFSNILRFAIDNIRLIGTRIIFTYMIYIGILDMKSKFSADREIWQWFDPAYWGYDPKINEFGPIGNDTVIKDIYDWPIVHRVKNCISNFDTVILIEKKQPYERGFVWHQKGNTNYKGFLLDEKTLQDDDTMYGYGTK